MIGEPLVVLVVEDEALIRMVLADVLSDEGYTVIQASNGQEALKVVRGLPSLDALVTDLQMPFVGGLAVAWAARKRWPKLPVIIASSALNAHQAVEAVVGSHHVPKPFLPGLLGSQLVRMISQPHPI
jgi:CheY-like chemotaxis protein